MLYTRIPWTAVVAALALAPLAACNSDTGPGNPPDDGPSPQWPDAGSYPPAPPPPGGIGATPGGVKDMRLARELVEQGQVPPPAAFLVEAMFAEHELGIAGEPCEALFCLQSAVAVAPDLDGTPSGWMQVGLSSSVDPAAFERPSTTLILTVDVSGSMSWEYADTEGSSGGSLARRLMLALTEELDERDRVAIVTFSDTAATKLELTSGADRAAIQAVIQGLASEGGTSIEAGVELAYELARAAGAGTDETRVVLITDAQPNIGATDASQFEAMVESGAEAGVHITVMGTALGLGQELVTAMSHVRGANAFSFLEPEDVTAFMADHWPWFLSPIAYDLSLAVDATPGVAIADAYGFPAPDGATEVGFDVSTIFLSRRKGALLLRVEPVAGGTPGALAEGDIDAGAVDAGPVDAGLPAFPAFALAANLAYLTPASEPITDTLDAVYGGEPLDARGHYYQQPGTAKTVALAVLVSAMRKAAELYSGDRAGAVVLMTAARDRFAADAAAMADPALDVEVAFTQALLDLMIEGAPQGDLYPY
jgi:Ca-activated chloride channel family protein